MPCDSNYGRDPASEAAQSSADNAANKAHEALRRVAALEEALCGLCQTAIAESKPLHPQVQAWFHKHKSTPGCSVR